VDSSIYTRSAVPPASTSSKFNSTRAKDDVGHQNGDILDQKQQRFLCSDGTLEAELTKLFRHSNSAFKTGKSHVSAAINLNVGSLYVNDPNSSLD
jgi:hypothetical protein